MRRILSILLLISGLGCITPDHTPTQPRGFQGLRGLMNHLPDGRWQFVLEMPNPNRTRIYQVEPVDEALEIQIEQDAPRSRATWIATAHRVESGQSFQLKLWADGDDFPIQVGFPPGGRDYRREGASTLVILSLIPRR
jgi:hypothetical protein